MSMLLSIIDTLDPIHTLQPSQPWHRKGSGIAVGDQECQQTRESRVRITWHSLDPKSILPTLWFLTGEVETVDDVIVDESRSNDE
jgi:hypothetical protein